MFKDYDKVLKLAQDFEDEIIDIRRQIHENPELSCREFQTSDFIRQKLDQMGVENKTIGDLEFIKEKMNELGYEFNDLNRSTGVLGKIGDSSECSKTVILRADIDGLPITETSNEDHIPNQEGFNSTNSGLMHACGHDSHTAMLLGAAKILKELENNINGCIKFLFQPAEEIGIGAKSMIRSDILKDANSIFGLHVFPELETGKIMINEGPMMAADDMVKIKVQGGGGHGSTPHETADPIYTTVEIINYIYKLMNHQIDAREPTVFTITKFDAGNTWNVIPEEVELEGTIRSFNKEIRKQIINKIKEVGNTISEMNNLDFSFETTYLDPPLNNTRKEAQLARTVGKELFGDDQIITGKPSMLAEDFAYYLEDIPGTFMFLGTKNKSKNIGKPLHSPEFDIDEKILEIGSSMHAGVAINYLNSN